MPSFSRTRVLKKPPTLKGSGIPDCENYEIGSPIPGKFKDFLRGRAKLHDNIINLASRVVGHEIDEFRVQCFASLIALDNRHILLRQTMRESRSTAGISLEQKVKMGKTAQHCFVSSSIAGSRLSKSRYDYAATKRKYVRAIQRFRQPSC